MTHTSTGARRSLRRAIQQSISTTLVAIVTIGIIPSRGDSATARTTTSVAGTYVLQTIDHAVLPKEISSGTATDYAPGTLYDQFILTIQRGTLVLDENGHYH